MKKLFTMSVLVCLAGIFILSAKHSDMVTLVSSAFADQPPAVTIEADSNIIRAGETATLSWSSTDADTASIDNGIGVVPVNGSMEVEPSVTTIYTITATGPAGTATDSIEITVAETPEDLDYGILSTDQYQGNGLIGGTICIQNGNNVDTRMDINLPSPRTPGLSFAAVYNSKSTASGVFGFGWMSTYSLFLDPSFVISGLAHVKIVDETGRTHYFEEQTSGKYVGVFAEKSALTIESGEFIWHRLDGSRCGFSSEGRLLWMDDEKENRLSLSYDAQSRPETVSDLSSGRILTFNYNAQGLLASISGPVTPEMPNAIWVTFGYDAGQNLISVTYADGSGFTYTYNDPADPHNLTEKRDKAGHLICSWSYDGQDRCIQSENPQGTGASINYISGTRIAATDAYGTVRTYTLGEINGRKVTAAMQGPADAPYNGSDIVSWQYDSELNLVETRTAGGTVFQYQDYDLKGNPQTVIQAAGTPQERQIGYTYHPAINTVLRRTEVSVLGAGDKETIWDYDNDGDTVPNENPTGLLSKIMEKGFTKNTSGNIAPYEYAAAYTYNGKGQVLAIDGPRPGTGDTVSFTYDPATGDLMTTNLPLVGSASFSNYDDAGNPHGYADINNQSMTFSYDGRGRVTSVTHLADNSTRTVSYNPAGLPSATADEDGVTYQYAYDAQTGRSTRTTDSSGNYIAYGYDNQGNRTEISKYDSSDTRAFVKNWSYQQPDMPGKLWKIIKTDGSFTRYDYDIEGNVSQWTDYNGNITQYSYDPLNRNTGVTQSGNATTAFAYDLHGNLASVTDADGNQTSYVYDDMGRMLSSNSPDAGATAYVYDSAGNTVLKTDANAVAVQYDYDALNRLTAMHFPDPSQDVSFTYDQGANGKGRLTQVTDPSGTINFSYDAHGRNISKTSTINAVAYPLTRVHTPAGRVASMTYPSGRTINYTRHDSGKVESISTTADSTTKFLMNDLTYFPFGGPLSLGTGAGSTVNNQYPECKCGVKVSNPGMPMEQVFTYDGNSNLLSAEYTHMPDHDREFTYDAQNRLESAEGPFGAFSWTYDRTGNRLSQTAGAETETYSYAPSANKLSQVVRTGGSVAYAYDPAGNIIGAGDRTLVYNQDNRLVQVSENSSVLGQYVYNALGQRVKKTASGVSTVYHYDFDGNLVAETGETGSLIVEYLYFGKNCLARADAAGHIYFQYNDRLGTPQVLVDQDNAVVWKAGYQPFGAADVNPNSSVGNNFRFPGQYYDAETGYHYNYHRYYDPGIGRYLTPDPIGLAGGINPYVYVSNNPINGVDPWGLKIAYRGSEADRGQLKAQVDALKDISPEIKKLVNDIYNSPYTVNVEFKMPATGIAGEFVLNDKGQGVVNINPALKTPCQEEVFYTIKPPNFNNYSPYYTLPPALAHELLGHGHDYISNPTNVVNDQNNAIRIENIVHDHRHEGQRYQ